MSRFRLFLFRVDAVRLSLFHALNVMLIGETEKKADYNFNLKV
jgi:hypothetical protein